MEKLKSTDQKAYRLFLELLQEIAPNKEIHDSKGYIARKWVAWALDKQISVPSTSGYVLATRAEKEIGLKFIRSEKSSNRGPGFPKVAYQKREKATKDTSMMFLDHEIKIDTRFRLKENRKALNQKDDIKAGQLMKVCNIDAKNGRIELKDSFSNELKVWAKPEDLETVDF